jgi:hypothetical protein
MEDKHLGGIRSNMTLAYVLHSQIVKKTWDRCCPLFQVIYSCKGCCVYIINFILACCFRFVNKNIL